MVRYACAICGGALREVMYEEFGKDRFWSEEMRWQNKIVLLYDPAREFETRQSYYDAGRDEGVPWLDIHPEGPAEDIQRVRAERGDGHDFLPLNVDDGDGGGKGKATASLAGTRVRVNARTLRDRRLSVNAVEVEPEPPAAYYIAAHEYCVDIAERVVARPRAGVRVRSLRTLWKVLRMRFEARDQGIVETGDWDDDTPWKNPSMWHGYYMPLKYRGGSRTTPRDKHWSMTDPMRPPGFAQNTPSFAESILGNLEVDPEEPVCYEIERFQERFLALPPELQELVMFFMETMEPLSTTPNRIVPQTYWKKMLARGRLLPFLWEVDAAAIDENTINDPAVALDWERLVRALSQPVVRREDEYRHGVTMEAPAHCYDGLDLSGGLRNRRRIWQLVEEMSVGDVEPRILTWHEKRSETLPSLPTYWDEDGEAVSSGFRIPRLLPDPTCPGLSRYTDL